MAAHMTARLEPIAVPVSWSQWVSLNWNTLFLVANLVACRSISVGKLMGSSSLCRASQFSIVCRAWSVLMFVHMDAASAVTRRAVGGSVGRALSLSKKVQLSLRCPGHRCTTFWSCTSTHLARSPMRLFTQLTMGLVFHLGFLWTLGVQ